MQIQRRVGPQMSNQRNQRKPASLPADNAGPFGAGSYWLVGLGTGVPSRKTRAVHPDYEPCPGPDGRNCEIWAPSRLSIHDKRRKSVPTLGFYACKLKVRFAIACGWLTTPGEQAAKPPTPCCHLREHGTRFAVFCQPIER